MSRMSHAAWAIAALTLAACGGSDPAKTKVFDACRQEVATRYPDTSKPGELTIDVGRIERVGNAMESCMTEFGYKYDESKSGCQLPPPYDARYYWKKSDVECYSSLSGK